MKLIRNWKGVWSCVLVSACLLAACGGGGVGSNGTGGALAVGTINGFGSIFVGGVRCDDTRAKVTYNTTSGAPETGTPDVKLGQSVDIVFDSSGGGCRVIQALVDPELVGVVSSVAPLTVAGQLVLVNADASVAPPTVFEGFDSAVAIQVGNRVEVHGREVVVNGVIAVQATRIELKSATDVWVRAKGVVSNLSASGFTLGALTVKIDSSTKLDPVGLVLAAGQNVVIWSNAAVAIDGSVSASVVSLARRALSDQQVVRVEGPVSGCGGASCTAPVIDGLSVDLSHATFVNGSLADVANGVAMRVEGRYDTTRSVLVAATASVRLRDPLAGEVNLIGLVSDFVSSSDFTVRGVPVTTDANTVVSAGCSVAAGQIVGIKGQLSTKQVVATRIDCLTLTDGTTLDIFGALLNVDTTAKTFNLSEGPYRTYTLTWDDQTVFGAGLASSLLANGTRVGLRAVLTDGKLLIKRIIGDAAPAAPTGVQLYGNFGIAHDVTAGSLSVGSIQMAIIPGTTTVLGSLADGVAVRTWFYRTGPLQPWLALQVSQVVWN